jgi:hypothetical protein
VTIITGRYRYYFLSDTGIDSSRSTYSVTDLKKKLNKITPYWKKIIVGSNPQWRSFSKFLLGAGAIQKLCGSGILIYSVIPVPYPIHGICFCFRDERGLSAELSSALLRYLIQSLQTTFHLKLCYIGSVNTVLKGTLPVAVALIFSYVPGVWESETFYRIRIPRFWIRRSCLKWDNK